MQHRALSVFHARDVLLSAFHELSHSCLTPAQGVGHFTVLILKMTKQAHSHKFTKWQSYESKPRFSEARATGTNLSHSVSVPQVSNPGKPLSLGVRVAYNQERTPWGPPDTPNYEHLLRTRLFLPSFHPFPFTYCRGRG